MRVLLDTHTLIWATLSPWKLTDTVASLISEETNDILVSSVCAWEIATKVRAGKLPGVEKLEGRFLEAMEEAGYTSLPITPEDALRAGRLPGEHRDPFDRILAAQALALDAPLLSADTKLDLFGVRRVW